MTYALVTTNKASHAGTVVCGFDVGGPMAGQVDFTATPIGAAEGCQAKTHCTITFSIHHNKLFIKMNLIS
jgi:hypothetical protein